MTEFTTELKSFAEVCWVEVREAIKDLKTTVIGFTLAVHVTKEFLDKYTLTECVEFVEFIVTSDMRMEYYFKGKQIKPDCYYLRPKEYHNVSTLRILQECVKQDTNTPDIKYLEDGLDEMPK